MELSNKNAKGFLSFGEILWDIIERTPYLGGAPFNVAAHLANWGVRSCFLSRLGNDELGKQAFNKARELGVDTSLIQWDEKFPTGTVEVFIEEGQPDYIINKNVAYDFIEIPKDYQEINPAMYSCLYFGTLIQRSQVSRKTLDWVLNYFDFETVFYDVNLRKDIISKTLIEKSLHFCNIFKLNQDEVAVISNLVYGRSYDIADFSSQICKDFNVETIIITASERGCYIYSNHVVTLIPGEKIELIDAVGAGDAFSAAFLYHYLHSKDPLKAAEIANKLGAFVASSRGAIPAYTEEIKKLFKNLPQEKNAK